MVAPLSTTTGTIELGGAAYKAWNCYQKWQRGNVVMTHPQNRTRVTNEWVTIEGTHSHAKGHFWLLTASRDQYWLQAEIDKQTDGAWKGTINVGLEKGERTCNVLLVWVSDFVHSLFCDIKNRSLKAGYHGPITMTPDPKAFKVVQVLVFNVSLSL